MGMSLVYVHTDAQYGHWSPGTYTHMPTHTHTQNSLEKVCHVEADEIRFKNYILFLFLECSYIFFFSVFHSYERALL